MTGLVSRDTPANHRIASAPAECVSLTAKRVCRTCSDTLHRANIPNAFLAPRRVFGLELTARPQVPSRSLTQEPPPQLPPDPHPMPPAPNTNFRAVGKDCSSRCLSAPRGCWVPFGACRRGPGPQPSLSPLSLALCLRASAPSCAPSPPGMGLGFALRSASPARPRVAEAAHVTSLAACAPLAVTAAKGSVGGEGGEVSLFLI